MMTFCYLPILKWKQGEQKALKEFPHDLRHCLLPVLELMKPKVATGLTLSATINNELPKTIKTMLALKMDEFPVGIDTSLMEAPLNDIKLTIYVANKLQKNGIQAIPVIHAGMLFLSMAEVNKLAEFPQLLQSFRQLGKSEIHTSRNANYFILN